MNRAFNALGLAALLALSPHARAAQTLDRIMGDPDWIGPPVESPYWSVDGKSIYYSLKRQGSTIRDLRLLNLGDARDRPLDAADQAVADGPDAVFDKARKRAAFLRHGDVFLRDVATGTLTQITKTTADEESVQFSADQQSLQFRVENEWFVHDLRSGVTSVAAVIRLEKDPAAKKLEPFEEMQIRLSSTLKRERDDREARRKRDEELRKGDATRLGVPFYLGDDVALVATSLSPNGRWLIVVTQPKGFEKGRVGKMPRYVTESGYEEVEDVRTRVEQNGFAPNAVKLLDLDAHEIHEIDLKALPGIEEDPLASIRAENEKAKAERDAKEAAEKKKAESASGEDQAAKGEAADKDKEVDKEKDKDKKDEAKTRPVRVTDIRFSRDGGQVSLQFGANDNKDRWIATVDFTKHALVPQHRLTDAAWVNWQFNDLGWLDDDKTLFYLSEESGFCHLYAKPVDGKARALTEGRFEVSAPALSPDGRWLYVRSNAEAPYVYDAYRVAVGGGALERVSTTKGLESFVVSPDGTKLLVAHSSSYTPRQLSVIEADGKGASKSLTDTRTAEYKALEWQQPEFVAVPSTHVKSPIWSKFYKPRASAGTGKRPIVLFVHGAGYTQNTHMSFPYYFREQMFHNLLTERGYLVLDMDYRASEGYGRDWRTSIYRQMGHPELEDLIDGVNWLVKSHNGDPKRVGLYGGSYGGFMTLMALFRAPDVFAAGAALRPVTDWSQYNHEYTSAILNTPKTDDIAYRRSSPIEYAESLKGSLLIAHGMVDDNVFFQDSVRLFQRLIELKKDNVELAPYPLESHGFRHPEAWRDEYARILKLFESNLRKP